MGTSHLAEPSEQSPRWGIKFGITLLAVQFGLLLVYTFAHQIQVGTPVLLWDQSLYYGDAVNFYRKFSLEGFKEGIRPIFSFPNVLLFRGLGLALNPSLLILSNFLVYQGIFLASTLWLFRLLGSGAIAGLAVVSTIWAAPQTFELGADLWGDIPTTAWVFLYTALLVYWYISTYSIPGSLLLGVVGALGLQIKPIFLFYALIATAVFLVMAMLGLRDRILARGLLPKFVCSLMAGILGAGAIAFLVFPKNLPQMIRDLAYTNEVLGYWQVDEGIFNSWLWFVSVFGENFNILILGLVLSVAVSGLAVVFQARRTMRKLPENPPSYFSKKLTGDHLGNLLESPILALGLTFGLLLLYASFAVKSKDFRSFHFLFALSVALGMIGIQRIFATKIRIFGLVAAVVILWNLLLTISWGIPHPTINWTSSYFQLKQGRIFTRRPDVHHFDTYQDLGIASTVEFLESLKRDRPESPELTVFLPHNSWRYNDAIFSAFSKFHAPIEPLSSAPESHLRFSSATFNFGVGVIDGGIPHAFFTNQILLSVPEHKFSAFNDPKINAYCIFIAAALSKRQPEFLEGLTEVYSRKSKIGETVVLYRRDRLPSPDSFVKIVNYLIAADPNNLFNAPFIYAALQIAPNDPELKSQIKLMADKNFLKSVRYHFRDRQRQEQVEALLQNYETKSYPEFLYPKLLEHFVKS